MSSLQFSGRIRDNVSVPVQQGQFTPSDGGRPQRKLSHQRKYEVAALMSDLSIETKQVVAPAIAAFEDTASAFARGTIIPTVSGPVAVEDLIPGDFVETEHGPEPVVWIGSTSYVPNVENTESSLTGLYRSNAGAFGDHGPITDTMFGPAARVRFKRAHLRPLIGNDSVLLPMADIVDGDRLIEVTPASSVQMFHIALRHHAMINVGGVYVESYHPGPNIKRTLGPDYHDQFLSLFPNVHDFEDFGEMALPRTRLEVIRQLTSG